MSEHYTDEDVEAAVRILQQPRMHTNMSGDKHRADMRAVLDAVAPAIAARALREGVRRYFAYDDELREDDAVGAWMMIVHGGDTDEAADWAEALSEFRAIWKARRADEIEGR